MMNDDDTIHQLQTKELVYGGPRFFFPERFLSAMDSGRLRHTDLHEVAILASHFGFPAVEVEKVRTV